MSVLHQLKLSYRLIFSYLLLSLTICSNAQISIRTIDSHANPNEPSIAIKPSQVWIKPMVAASNIDNFYTNPLNPKLPKSKSTSKYGVYGDPVLHYSDTTLFFAHLSKTPGKSYGEWFDRIVVQKIENPYTWKETSYSVGYNKDKMQDKPWLSSDNHSDRYNGNVYVTWTEFDKYDSDDPDDRSRIRFSKYELSTDSFNTAITISDTTGDCLDGDNTLEGATTAIGKDGTIYAVWAGLYYIWLDKSTDGGTTWGTDRKIASQPKGWDMDMPNIMRANGMPFIQSDTARDILYITWADEYSGNADVWLLYSQDQGKSWSERIRVNQDTSNRGQYFPNMVVDQATGSVFIAYYDFRHSSSEAFYNIMLNTFSIEDGMSEYLITPEAIPLPGKNVFYGDYLDLDVQGSNLAILYTANTIANETRIKIAHTNLYQKHLIERKGNSTNAIGIVDQNDSLVVQCNAIIPYRLDVKVKIRDANNHKRKIKKSVIYKDLDQAIDHRILGLQLADTEYIKKAEFTLRYFAGNKKQIQTLKNYFVNN